MMYVVHYKMMQVTLGRDLMRELEFKLLDPEGMIALNNTICEIMNIELNDASVVV